MSARLLHRRFLARPPPLLRHAYPPMPARAPINATPYRGLAVTASPAAEASHPSSVSHPSSTPSAPSAPDAFLNTTSAPYLQEMYAAWRSDPASVHVSWKAYFSALRDRPELPARSIYQSPPASSLAGIINEDYAAQAATGGVALPATASAAIGLSTDTQTVHDHLRLQLMVRAYQVRGHHLARLDPLGISDKDQFHRKYARDLGIDQYGFTETDLDRHFTLGAGMLKGFITADKPTMTLREIVHHLQDIYCGSIGIEYTHIPDRAMCDWIRERVEKPNRINYSIEDKRMILDRLVWSDSFERFVRTKFPSEKRFGLEGCESLIPGMKAMIDRSVDLGVREINLGMPHRGRLNVLSNVVRKPNESIFCEFNGNNEPNVAEGSGDVKYHLGMNYDRPTPSGHRVHLSLVANPSHLEAVNPVVLGKTRATQFYQKDAEKAQTMAVLLHGDAAFAAQGVVYETIGMVDLPAYSTGGTIHVVVNNQIGFTTDPRFARSTPYCTDIARAINAPVFHVNGDDVEAVTWVCQLAADWRQQFKRDVVVDIVCYRKYGHNEIDQPAFTQPLMYQKIQKHPAELEIYSSKLLKEGTFSENDIKQNKEHVWRLLEESYAMSKDYQPTTREWLSSSWHGFKSPKELAGESTPVHHTGTPLDILRSVGQALCSYPTDFNIHPNLAKIMDGKRKTINEGAGIDMPTAEALAFGTLLLESKHVRLSGQDVERGTFSQRHSVLHDQKTERQYVMLNNISSQQAEFTVCNSSLSEFGTMGFELGYSLVDPNALVIWEAQFGDFSNNAQCIIDQFIASGEKKWIQRTGLVLSLPHGYDGQGPEHSSTRIERFLQLCDDHPYQFPDALALVRQHQDCNMQVVYPSTPANLFHVLRRQIHRDFRKPLILCFSKSLLRHPQARSTLEDMAEGTMFKRYIPEPHPAKVLDPANKIRRHILCSGQVYYALLKAREQLGIRDIALSRVEQISPFPYDLVRDHLDLYPNAEVVWAQEEPLNMGAWTYVQPRIQSTMEQTKTHAKSEVKYVARNPSGAVATGKKKLHKKEESQLVEQAFA